MDRRIVPKASDNRVGVSWIFSVPYPFLQHSWAPPHTIRGQKVTIRGQICTHAMRPVCCIQSLFCSERRKKHGESVFQTDPWYSFSGTVAVFHYAGRYNVLNRVWGTRTITAVIGVHHVEERRQRTLSHTTEVRYIMRSQIPLYYIVHSQEVNRMKNTHTCPKCSSRHVVRVPDNPGRHASGNNIYTTTLTLTGKVPVIRYVCGNCGYVENWVEQKSDLAKVSEKFGQ